MAPHAYKIVNTHAHEISVWTILSRLVHFCAPRIGGLNGYIQYDLATLEFNNGEQLDDFYIRILILQQKIIFSVETVYLTILIFRYMKALSNSDKLKAFIAPNMTDLITFLDKNGKLAVYKGGNIHGLYRYLEIIGSPTELTTSGQHSNHFCSFSSANNDTATLQQVIALSAWYRRVFVNAVEGLYTRLIPVSSVALNYSHKVL